MHTIYTEAIEFKIRLNEWKIKKYVHIERNWSEQKGEKHGNSHINGIEENATCKKYDINEAIIKLILIDPINIK